MFSTTTSTPTQPAPYKILMARDSSDNTIEYVGYAAPYASSSTAGWYITRNTYKEPVMGGLSKSDHPQGQFIDGGMKFNQVWDNRESLTYA